MEKRQESSSSSFFELRQWSLNFDTLESVSVDKQLLSITNHYHGLRVRYKILSSNPRFYTVTESEGHIQSNSVKDIIISNIAPEIKRSAPDKFKLLFYDFENGNCLEEKNFELIKNNSQESLVSVKNSETPTQRVFHLSENFDPLRESEPRNINYAPCFAALICIGALFFPTEEESSSLSQFPWIAISVNLKIVCAYVLGLVTIALLKGP